MTQVTNYCSQRNQAYKAKTQVWTVTSVYADPSLNTQALYRSERGARQQEAYVLRQIASDASRNLGTGKNREVPVVGVIVSKI